MKKNNIPIEKLMEILPHINSVKVRLGENIHWVMFPLISFGGEQISIIAKKDSKKYFETNHSKLLIKFNHNEMEYVIGGEMINKKTSSQVIAIKIHNPIQYRVLKHYPRLDISIGVSISGEDGNTYDGIIQNISEGGASFISTINADLSNELNLNIQIDQTQRLTTMSKILSKKGMDNNFYNYGVKFINLNKNAMKALANKMEDIKKSTCQMRKEYRIVPHGAYQENCNIAVLSYDILSSKYIEDALVNIGTKNYYMVGTYGALKASIVEEEPCLIIVDGTKSNEARVSSAINKLTDLFENINIILIVPLKFENIGENITQNNTVDIMYYPLIQDELEQILLKYL
jgi:hypothetical protein